MCCAKHAFRSTINQNKRHKSEHALSGVFKFNKPGNRFLQCCTVAKLKLTILLRHDPYAQVDHAPTKLTIFVCCKRLQRHFNNIWHMSTWIWKKHDFSFGFESENSPKHGFDVAGTGHVLIYGKCSGLTDSPVPCKTYNIPTNLLAENGCNDDFNV